MPSLGGDDEVALRPRLAEVGALQLSASRFQESALFSRRNSVGVSPVAALKARLNGPID